MRNRTFAGDLRLFRAGKPRDAAKRQRIFGGSEGTVNFSEAFQLTLTRVAFRWLSLCLAPPTCWLCGGPGREWQGQEPGPWGRWHRIPLDLCEYCGAALPRPAQAWTRSWMPGGSCAQFAAFRYAAPVDRMIRQYKFHGERVCGRVLATLLGGQRASALDAPLPDVIVPVPMHPRRYRERGFDHALLLARWVSEILAVPVAADLLTRTRATPPQAGLAGAARRSNVQGAFAVREPARGLSARNRGDMPPRGGWRIALLDDVLTTGSTLAAATAALRAAGHRDIEHWVLARTALPEEILERDADEHHEAGIAVLDERLETLRGVARANLPLLSQETGRHGRETQVIPESRLDLAAGENQCRQHH